MTRKGLSTIAATAASNNSSTDANNNSANVNINNNSNNNSINNKYIVYRTKRGESRQFDISEHACKRFGFYHNQRVHTPNGPATVIGVSGNPPVLWFHVDGDSGASYWDSCRSMFDHAALGFRLLSNENNLKTKKGDTMICEKCKNEACAHCGSEAEQKKRHVIIRVSSTHTDDIFFKINAHDSLKKLKNHYFKALVKKEIDVNWSSYDFIYNETFITDDHTANDLGMSEVHDNIVDFVFDGKELKKFAKFDPSVLSQVLTHYLKHLNLNPRNTKKRTAEILDKLDGREQHHNIRDRDSSSESKDDDEEEEPEKPEPEIPAIFQQRTEKTQQILLNAAAMSGDLEVIQNVLYCNKNGTPIKDFINKKDAYGNTPLHIACAFGHIDVALSLLLEGADMSIRDLLDMTAVDLCAAHNEDFELLAHLLSCSLGKQLLLPSLYDSDDMTEHSSSPTPFHYAYFYNKNPEIAQQILKFMLTTAAGDRIRTHYISTTLFSAVVMKQCAYGFCVKMDKPTLKQLLMAPRQAVDFYWTLYNRKDEQSDTLKEGEVIDGKISIMRCLFSKRGGGALFQITPKELRDLFDAVEAEDPAAVTYEQFLKLVFCGNQTSNFEGEGRLFFKFTNCKASDEAFLYSLSPKVAAGGAATANKQKRRLSLLDIALEDWQRPDVVSILLENGMGCILNKKQRSQIMAKRGLEWEEVKKLVSKYFDIDDISRLIEGPKQNGKKAAHQENGHHEKKGKQQKNSNNVQNGHANLLEVNALLNGVGVIVEDTTTTSNGHAKKAKKK